MTPGAPGALCVFVREMGPGLGFPSNAVSLFEIPTVLGLGAVRVLPNRCGVVLGRVEAEAGRAGMSSPCDGVPGTEDTGTGPGHAARGCCV